MKLRRTLYRAALFIGAAAVLMGLGLVSPAQATNGYFAHGYGTANKALAGAGVALPQDAMAPATNPAGLAFIGKRYDAGLALFNPNRNYTVDGNPSGFPGTFGLLPQTVDSDSTVFAVPHFGASWKMGGGATTGVAIYGHGGMNTDYPTNVFFGSSPTGVDLSQLFIVPTWAKQFSGGKHAFGVSPIFAYQLFEAQGIQAFGAFSSNPAALSNNGHDTAFGFGLKLGYLGQWTPKLSFGISYQSKISMGEFDDYAGLFAEQGDFDIPSTITAGIAVKASPTVTFVFDIQEIYYTDVAAVSNPFMPNIGTSLLGNNDGAGFGWEDMTIFKAGVQWETGGDWTWRVGASTGDQPIPETEVLFNILAPGVMEEHLTFGFTKKLGGGGRAINLSLMHAPSVTVRGPNPLEVPGLQEIELEMDQWDLEVSFSWGF